jgi:tRNA modification GTPase
MDTIFAQASAVGRAGVSVLRVSGPKAFSIAERIAGFRPVAHRASLRLLKDGAGQVIDQALVLGFQGPNSFTGEDVVELHLHGSIAVVRAVMEVLSLQENTRLAEAGEFTRRALENGKMDLTQVEGLADLIESETEAQRQQALRVLNGHLGQRVDGWRKEMVRAAALLEATIDFADEDVPVDVTPEVKALLNGVLNELRKEIENTKTAERIRTGFEVAIVGRPNVGKSTLLNALAGRDAAITSTVAGTTRDVIEVRMDLGGLPVTLLDTAGIRETEDLVEVLGIERARNRAEMADIRIFLVEGDEEPALPQLDHDLVLQAKSDTKSCGGISGKTGEGIPALIKHIQSTLKNRTTDGGLATHERHRVALERSASGLVVALQMVANGPDLYDIAAEELRHGIRALESLIGRVDVENLLDEIFSSFCIGK